MKRKICICICGLCQYWAYSWTATWTHSPRSFSKDRNSGYIACVWHLKKIEITCYRSLFFGIIMMVNDYFSLFFSFVAGVMKLSFIIRFFCAPSRNPNSFYKSCTEINKNFIYGHPPWYDLFWNSWLSSKHKKCPGINELLSSCWHKRSPLTTLGECHTAVNCRH